MSTQNPFDEAAILVAQRSNERALDALRMVTSQEPRPDRRWRQLVRQANFAQGLHELANEKPLTGANREIHDHLGQTQIAMSSNSMLFPLEGLQTRADTVANSSALVDAPVLPAADALRPMMVTGGLGATIIPLPARGAGNFSLPVQSGAATAYWLNNEETPITESDQAFSQAQFTPRTVGMYTEISRRLNLQAPAVMDVVNHDQARTVGRALDLAAIYGSGADGQPLGLTGQAGIGSFSAASLSLTSLIAAQTAMGNALTASAGFAATLANAGTMRTRQEFSAAGDVCLWNGSLLAGTCGGLPARSSTALTANQLILGSWEFLNIAIWGGLEVSVNPYDRSNFQAGIIGVRTFLTLDVGLTYAAAFSVGNSFS